MFSSSQACPSPGDSGRVVHMAVECAITSLRMARIGSASAESANLILYSGFMSTIVDSMAAFGERLRAARRARDWPIDRLASASGVSRAMISKIERGESSPTAVVLGKLSAALELSIAELLAAAPAAAPAAAAGAGAQPPGQAPAGGLVRRAADAPEWRDPDTG